MAITEKIGRDVESTKMITNYIYFYHLDKFCVLPAYPESITDNMNSTFRSSTALARSAPVWTFSNSGPREINVQLDLHRDLMNDLNTGVSNFKDAQVVPFKNQYDENGDFEGNDYIDILIKYLQAMALPKYQLYNKGSKAVIPPMVALRFGDDIFIKGIVNNGVRVTYRMPIMTDRYGNNKYAKVQIGFNVTETDPYDADTVVAMGSFRGICGTNNIYASNSINERAQFGDINIYGEAELSNGDSIEENDFVVRNIPGIPDRNKYQEKAKGLETDYDMYKMLMRKQKEPFISYVTGKKVETYKE